MATSFGDETRRHQATQAIVQLDSLHTTENRNPHTDNTRYATINEVTMRRTEDARTRLGSQGDETLIRNSVVEAEQMSAKEYSKWNWEVLIDLLHGPLLNLNRFDDALKNYKFLKRVLQFFKPSSQCYSELRNIKTNFKYTGIILSLLGSLLKTEEGARVLDESLLIVEIADHLTILESNAGLTQDILFSESRLEDTMTFDYFSIIGFMLKDDIGLVILEQNRIITILYRLIENYDRDDINILILKFLDFDAYVIFDIYLTIVMVTKGYYYQK